MTVKTTTPSSSSTKIKYINNRELLAEIHKCKKSFCFYLEPQHADFDVIVPHTRDITDELIEQVRRKKSTPRGKPSIPLEEIPPESIVIRVMTYEHIPIDPERTRKPKDTDESYTKTSFKPFKHYIKIDGALREVCRSHWKNGFENGHFCVDGGKISNRLASMFMLLVERYSRRGNWRNYTYRDEMCGLALLQLSQIGLQFDESKSDNPFAFYTTAIKNSFVRTLNTEKKNQNIRDDLLIIAGANPSYTRQIDNELEYRFPSEGKPEAPKRGRKAAPSKDAA